MPTREIQRSAVRGKAEEVLARQNQKESDLRANRVRERQAQDEKIARLRLLRLAKEAADREAPPTDARRRKVVKTA